MGSNASCCVEREKDEEEARGGGSLHWNSAKSLKLLTINTAVPPSDKYEIGVFLGKGGYGEVRRCTNKDTQEICVMKSIRLKDVTDEKFLAMLEMEVSLQMKLDHPHTVRIYEIFQDPATLSIALEACNGGDVLETVVKEPQAFDEPCARHIFRQIIQGVSYMHNKTVAHRDLKLENVFIKEDTFNPLESHVKIGDFGLSKEFVPGQASFKSTVGSPDYVPPDIFTPPYSESCDVWSCGVILFGLCIHRLPFSGPSMPATIAKVKRGIIKFKPSEWENYSPDVQTLVGTMCNKDRTKRPTANSMLECEWLLKQEVTSPSAATKTKANIQAVSKNMKSFVKTSKFKQQALNTIAHMMSDGKISEISELFEAMDKDGKGVLSIEEVHQALGDHLSTEEIKEAFASIDSSGGATDGNIDYREWIAMNLLDVEIPESKIRAAFKIFDKDGDGKISRKELEIMTEDHGHLAAVDGVDLDRVQEIVSQYDTDGDGEIDFNEFMVMLRTM